MLNWSVPAVADVIFVGDVCDLFLQFFSWSSIFSCGYCYVGKGDKAISPDPTPSNYSAAGFFCMMSCIFYYDNFKWHCCIAFYAVMQCFQYVDELYMC